MATTSATITFSQAGVQPPVYVTSALSGWTPLEMDVAPDKTPDGHVLFTKTFTNVPQGSYQYKVRLGQDHWVLDESKETAADDQGIHNNVIHVEPANDTTPQTSIPDAAPTQSLSPNDAPVAISNEPASKRLENRKDSTMDQDQLPDLPADTKPFKSEQASKVDSPVGSETSKQPDVPLVVLDKVDDIPAHGEQSSKDATAAQKVARDMRAADASPDKVNIVPEQHTEPDPVQLSADQEQAAPMFRHESFQSEEPPAAPSMDTIDEESTPSSADQTSSGDAMDTPSELDDGDEGDELNIMPLLSHETALGQESREIANGSLFTDEAELDDHPVHQAPLFSHETNLPDDTAVTTDSDGADELDRHPLLAHESGLSDYKGSEIVTKSDYTQEEKPRHRGPFDDDDEFDEYPEGPDGDAPLLPHEREAANANNTGSDSGHDDGSFSMEKQSTFDYETDNAKSLFGGTARHDFFRPRTNSSLPHRLPRSDAEDEDLNDPSLERFPTNRDQIFQRVATIGTTLPEDETRHSHPHSPQPSVFSQACSSVDLAPVKSYTSLASVPEADDSDEEEEDNHDLDSIPSPVYIGKKHMLRMSNSPSAFARDPYATPVTEASKRLGDAIETKDHAIESSGETDYINSHDGAEDTPEPANTLRDAISMPDKADATPVKSSRNEISDVAHSDPVVDSNLRQRKGVAEEASQQSDAPRTADDDSTTTKDKSTDAVSSSSTADTQQSEKRQDASSKPSGVSRLLTACVGDRKVASASALVLGGAIAVYYFVGRAS